MCGIQWSRAQGGGVCGRSSLCNDPGVGGGSETRGVGLAEAHAGAGAGVGWGLENERSKDSLRREEGPPSPDAPQSERPGGLSAALQVLPEPGFAGQGERWVE